MVPTLLAVIVFGLQEQFLHLWGQHTLPEIVTRGIWILVTTCIYVYIDIYRYKQQLRNYTYIIYYYLYITQHQPLNHME